MTEEASGARSILRQLLILEDLDQNLNVSQRSLAEHIGMAVSLVNRCIRSFIKEGYVQVLNPNVRPYAYCLTPSGREYRRRLSHQHYRSVLGSFRDVQERIRRRLREIKRKGVSRLVFYGSGDVMETTYPLAKSLGLEMVGVVDDDPAKQGATRGTMVVQPPASIRELDPDAVLITTFRHAREIQGKIDPGLHKSIFVLEL